GLLGAAQFLAFVAFSGKFFPHWTATLERSMKSLLAGGPPGGMEGADAPLLVRGLFVETLAPLALFGAVLLTVPLALHLSMTRFGFSLGRLTPQFNRLNPVSRLKDLPLQNLKATVEAVLLLGALSLALYSFWESNAALLLRLPFQGIRSAAAQIGTGIE